MNSYKFNSKAQYYLRYVISKALNIELSDVYKTIEDIKDNIVTTKDGKQYVITLVDKESYDKTKQKYNQAFEVLDNPNSYDIRDVSNAEQFIKKFNLNKIING